MTGFSPRTHSGEFPQCRRPGLLERQTRRTSPQRFQLPISEARRESVKIRVSDTPSPPQSGRGIALQARPSRDFGGGAVGNRRRSGAGSPQNLPHVTEDSAPGPEISQGGGAQSPMQARRFDPLERHLAALTPTESAAPPRRAGGDSAFESACE